MKRIFTREDDFKFKALQWANTFDHCIFLNYTESNYNFGSFPCILAVGAFEKLESSTGNSFNDLKKFHQNTQDSLFGYLGYDLKNEIENLNSTNKDSLGFADLFFFKPLHILHFREGQIEITSKDPDDIFKKIQSFKITKAPAQKSKIEIKQRVSKDQYFKNIEQIKNHLVEGDIYELNYCMEFYAENSTIDPLETFLKLNQVSPMPFSAFMKNGNDYCISASPERFLKKEKSKLITQPIKGTSKRGNTSEEDEQYKIQLLKSEKEKSENMMIVDLVRNDLARSSKPGTVKVDELFGIYSFKVVHQMISTVSSELRDNVHFMDAIKNAFPMGSMTGAPKVKAMELIEKFEDTKRGLFSGAIGYITPEGDFDFNVVIRSIFYSSEKKYISFQVGSAITFESDPDKEYEECFVKADAMRKTLEN